LHLPPVRPTTQVAAAVVVGDKSLLLGSQGLVERGLFHAF
jgi:hypothetical protein